eukprot:5377655-Pyramimonas_sp.AAC.1
MLAICALMASSFTLIAASTAEVIAPDWACSTSTSLWLTDRRLASLILSACRNDSTSWDMFCSSCLTEASVPFTVDMSSASHPGALCGASRGVTPRTLELVSLPPERMPRLRLTDRSVHE